MSLLRVENLVKTFGDKTLFDRISFTIEAGERIGIIGVNGTGKSSLLRALSGVEAPDQGELIHANEFRVEFVAQDPEVDENATVLETVFYGDAPVMKAIRTYEEALEKLQKADSAENQAAFERAQSLMEKENAWEAGTQAKTILTKLGITTFSKPMGELSGGQRRRTALAKALIQPADLLLLDEPTNHLDNQTIEWLETYLNQYSGALMIITHDRYFLQRVTNRMMELHEGTISMYEGNYETYLEKKAERERMASEQEAKRQNLLRREMAWLKRGAKARSTKQKARKQRVEALQEEEGPTEKQELDFAVGSRRLGKNVIELDNVGVARGSEALVDHLSYLINRGERLGIIGPNGAGKTTLLEVIAGREKPSSGRVEFGETVRIGYYRQEHEPLDGSLRMIDYIKETAEAVQTIDGNWITAEQMLERFMFSRAHQFTHIKRLSGGEKRRLYLLKVLMEEPNVLLLDEPTNDLDTETLTVLEDYLDQFPGVVITVSHDRYFLDRTMEKLLVLRNGTVEAETFYGSYSEWLEQEKEAARQEKKPAAERPAARPKKKKLSYHEQQEWKTIEEDITSLEEKLESLEAGINEAGADFDRARDLFQEKQETEDALEQKMERWEELSVKVEEAEQQ
ncbi:ABC-F family ATP-binding cassette domain-containing protein [Alkalicoccus urumqiensis]|uniref:Multidrug ABC transporter ATP-binding protein n=1 Tax=Alkalicoccus urumqiensis TaxID=1548213 RepID=A0A2P6MIM4_ALKUR|nr:ABC-F family ATP-binding cassette domain-containing protein [Alkalicoccus urumqiensis]PRO66130.1 multidrug ABC transporter ATP-binding protein [Alkalicoccus urumqiensis]